MLHDDEWDCPVVPLLADEIVKDRPGQEAVLDRLLDLLLIAVLRAWCDRPGSEAPDWYRACGDPVVGHALRLLHHNPAHPWTVAELAHATGASRAALARLRQPVRAQHGVRGAARHQPAAAPRRGRTIRRVTSVPEHDVDPRFSLANERTFLAWIRTAVALVAAGLLAAKALEFHHEVLRWAVAGPPIVAGAVLAADSRRRWREYEDAMRRGQPLLTGRGLPALAIAVALYALLVLVAIALD